VRHMKLRHEGVEAKLDKCNSLCNYCGAMRKLAPRGCSAIRGQMITAQEIRVRAGRKGAAAQAAAKGDGKSKTLGASLRKLAAICAYLRVGAKFSREDGGRQGIKKGQIYGPQGAAVPLRIAWYRLAVGAGAKRIGETAKRRVGVSASGKTDRPSRRGGIIFTTGESACSKFLVQGSKLGRGVETRGPLMPAYARLCPHIRGGGDGR
jgi:hypothetical protein